MKTKTSVGAAIIAAFLVQGVASASHRSANLTAAQAPTGNAEAAASLGSPAEDNMAWKVASYPFRAGYTVVRTPLIIGETIAGKRTFVGDRGLFQANEESAMEQRDSVPQGRGQRTPAKQRAGQ